MVSSLPPAIFPRSFPGPVKYFLYSDLRSSALRTGIFFGSPPPIKKWHLSAQAPHLTQMSKKSWKERYLLSLSFKPSRNISFQFSGSFQSSSATDHALTFGMPVALRLFSFAPQQHIPFFITVGVSIQDVLGGL